eukprot:TRINITY_DN5444_c0_g1_i4.p1 TRINITY_DN5444_c0_g1~~TRINITY_DN5444_c0_g1_i4.p1  ORF type:complete len:256 (-),score=30.29 TRINITY_DN5444_c0_g1_i4:156-923(-)
MSPERSKSQVKLGLSAEKLNDQKKTSLGTKFTPKVAKCDIPKLRPGADSCTVLPNVKDLSTTDKATPVKPPNKPPVAPINTDVQVYKPIIKLEPVGASNTPEGKKVRSTHLSTGELPSSSGAQRKQSYSDTKPRMRLPPRPNYKRADNREVLQRVNAPAVTSKYVVKSSFSSSKPVNLSFDYRSTVQTQAYKPVVPSYGKYIKADLPSWGSYGSVRESRSYSSSTPQAGYSKLSASVVKPYGVYSTLGNNSFYRK